MRGIEVERVTVRDNRATEGRGGTGFGWDPPVH